MTPAEYQKLVYSFAPQISKPESGAEPTLSAMIQHYYERSGMSASDVSVCAGEYLRRLYAEFVGMTA